MEYMQQNMPWLDPIIKALRIGPGRDAKIEARFSGPGPRGIAASLAEEAKAIMRADPTGHGRIAMTGAHR